MNPLEKLAIRLSLTKAEISLVSILLGFLVLGGILKNIRSQRRPISLSKKRKLPDTVKQKSTASSAWPQWNRQQPVKMFWQEVQRQKAMS